MTQTTAGALRRHAAACHPLPIGRTGLGQRIGSARVQARNWRLMAFGCLSLALLTAGGFALALSAVHRHARRGEDRPARCEPSRSRLPLTAPVMRRSRTTWPAS
ncbi:MAG: VirB8/TrbF family protein [Burkholderiaceae bacterium]